MLYNQEGGNLMTSRLADHLDAARYRQFIGRVREQPLFQSALTTSKPPFHLLYVFGPGGIGKTTLLGKFVSLCQDAQVQAIAIDARNIEPSPNSFVTALGHAMGVSPQDTIPEVFASQPSRHVILIDTYEQLAPLDDWLRENFLPQLPENVITVLAGRQPPAVSWRTDPGWQTLMRILPLRNLSLAESRVYLTQRQIPPEHHQGILDFTHGHPLALSLVADVSSQGPSLQFHPGESPDVIKTLLEQFVENVPSRDHRQALEACALVYLTTESLLAELLKKPDVHELFEWLRGLSFIDPGQRGVFPHDLVREVLTADLRWRDPDWYAQLHRRAHAYYTRHKQQTHGEAQRQVLFDFMFLHRNNPAVRASVEWKASVSVWTDTMRDTDVQALLTMAAKHEGEASAHLASYWFARQPEGVQVLRNAQQQPSGFLMMLAVQEATPDDLNADPAVRKAWEYLQSYAPLRPGERATLFRFWMAEDTYQAVSPIQSLLFINVIQHYLTTEGLAFTFFPCAAPDFWAEAFAYVDLARIPEADFEVDGRHYGVYGHDWRAVPPAAWSNLLAEREIATSPEPIPPPTIEPSIVLSESDFAAAVREVLRDFSRFDKIRGNPLLRSRLVMNAANADAGETARIETLLALLEETIASLQSSPREAKFYRALYRTYLNPAPSQERAAEVLDLPFSTYRRHLKSGVMRVTELLWQREISGL
ncbi:MAG: ATP-binding protein [Candidatus Poribacteria bacterium]|nr:ATP-binding protein [Candidatus Poribacteria bacterium]